MHPAFQSSTDAIPVTFATKSTWDAVSATLPAAARRFAVANAFTAKPGQYLALPAEDGSLAHVLFGIEDASSEWRDLFRPGQLPGLLPAGTYSFANAPHDTRLAVLAFALGSYRFNRYRKNDAPGARLVPPEGVDMIELTRMAEAAALARDLINTPANDMGPDELAEAAQALAVKFDATYSCIIGDDLLKQNFPLIHAVGMASTRAPRLIDITWGDASHPKVTLVGKGVCFDTGGISIKPAGGMEDMKGDMAGAACVTGLMQALAARKAKVNAVGVIGLVENMPDGKAQRPGDIVTSLSGQTIEIINTDAEGRLVLADVLWYTQERFKPVFMVNLATLTGAILVALAQENAGLFSNNDELSERLFAAGKATGETVWRMPLSPAYDKMIDSKFADMKNSAGRHDGSITAAQFLQRHVNDTPWVHLDIAGTGMGSPNSETNRSWGSGWGVRLLDRLVADHYES